MSRCAASAADASRVALVREDEYEGGMSDLTFRDFAGAIMGADTARAAEVLSDLLGVDADTALAATTHFQSGMKTDPSFMGKAMGLRSAVTGGTDEDLATLLASCFGLGAASVPIAIVALRKKYPSA